MRVGLGSLISLALKSRARRWLAVLASTLLFGLFQFGVSSWCIDSKLNPILHSMLQACIVGIGAGAAVALILLGMAERNRILQDEMRRLSELNHTIRNSLEIIVLTHYTDEDSEHRSIVMECANRIDRKLSELFPSSGTIQPRK